MGIKYYIRLYTRHHILIDELYIFGNVKYTKTLNGIGNMEFTMPIRYLKEKNIELALGQHIELYLIENNEENILWYGVVNSPVPSGPDIQCTCLGYACLLQNRNFTYIDIDSENEWKKTYYNKQYGNLIQELIREINDIYDTGIGIGTIQPTTQRTDRIINWDDDLYDKIQEFIEESNCYFLINKDRFFNFYTKYGKDKSEYYEINDYNIIGQWDYTIDETQIFNSIHARTVYTESGENGDQVTTILKSDFKDDESIKMYGMREMPLTVNEIKLQETLDEQCKDALAMYKDPLVTCNVEIGICDSFNIFDIEPGDTIKLNTEKYNLNIKIRVLEYTVDLTKNTVNISLGNAIFRDVKPNIYRYS